MNTYIIIISSGDTDFQENISFSTVSNLINNKSEETELLQEVDYNSDYECFGRDSAIESNSTHNIDDISKNDDNGSNNINQNHNNNGINCLNNNKKAHSQNGRSAVIQSTSASVFDNWESLQVRDKNDILKKIKLFFFFDICYCFGM